MNGILLLASKQPALCDIRAGDIIVARDCRRRRNLIVINMLVMFPPLRSNDFSFIRHLYTLHCLRINNIQMYLVWSCRGR